MTTTIFSQNAWLELYVAVQTKSSRSENCIITKQASKYNKGTRNTLSINVLGTAHWTCWLKCITLTESNVFMLFYWEHRLDSSKHELFHTDRKQNIPRTAHGVPHSLSRYLPRTLDSGHLLKIRYARGCDLPLVYLDLLKAHIPVFTSLHVHY